jgi:hypothetical protein
MGTGLNFRNHAPPQSALRSEAVGLVDGKPQSFCCPACALTAHRQTGKVVDIRQLTDFEAGAGMNPASAFIAVGSDTNHCTGALHPFSELETFYRQ